MRLIRSLFAAVLALAAGSSWASQARHSEASAAGEPRAFHVWADGPDGSSFLTSGFGQARGKASVSTPAPAIAQWLVLRCAFPDSPTYAYSVPRTRQIFEMPDVGLFAFYERQSQGRTSQSIAAVVEATLPQPRSHYLQQATHLIIEQTQNECMSTARATGQLVGVSFNALAVFYNDELDGFAYGGKYELADGARIPAMWIPALAAESPAIVAHELGHAFGLRHSNNSDGDFDTTDNYWDLMSQVYWNAVFERTDWFGFLPKALQARHRWELGWLDAEQVNVVDATQGNDRTEVFELLSGELIRIERGQGRELVVSFLDAIGPDAGLRTEPAVFLHTYDPARPAQYPMWVVDAAVPTPSLANTDTSYFTTGEAWTLHEEGEPRDITVQVVSTNDTLARVLVHLGPPPQVFADGFDSNAGEQQ